MTQISVSALDHLVLTVADIDETIAFYQNILGMTAEGFTAADGTKRWALKFGAQKINLHLAGHEFEPKAAQVQVGSADLCFLSDTPLADWEAHVLAHGVAIEEGPTRRTGAVGPLISIYVRDPSGNLIEISNSFGA